MILNVVGYTISYQKKTFFVPNVNRWTTYVRGYVQERTERESIWTKSNVEVLICWRGATIVERRKETSQADKGPHSIFAITLLSGTGSDDLVLSANTARTDAGIPSALQGAVAIRRITVDPLQVCLQLRLGSLLGRHGVL